MALFPEQILFDFRIIEISCIIPYTKGYLLTIDSNNSNNY